MKARRDRRRKSGRDRRHANLVCGFLLHTLILPLAGKSRHPVPGWLGEIAGQRVCWNKVQTPASKPRPDPCRGDPGRATTTVGIKGLSGGGGGNQRHALPSARPAALAKGRAWIGCRNAAKRRRGDRLLAEALLLPARRCSLGTDQSKYSFPAPEPKVCEAAGGGVCVTLQEASSS